MKHSVSVIIPAYNAGHSLPAAIGSVRAQQRPDVEIIVVDDGSTDNTPSVLASLAGGDLRVFQQRNAGVSAARNQGIKEAQGDWVAFLDADDKWLPEKLNAQFEVIGQTADAGLSFTDVRFLYDDGKTRDLLFAKRKQPLLIELLIGNILVTSSIMVRRDCLQQVGEFDTTMRTGEDWDMWLRVVEQYKSVHLPEVAVLYRADRAPNVVKYPLEMLECCTMRVIERFFERCNLQQHTGNIRAVKRHVRAWQYAVLAKSYLQQNRKFDFVRLLLKVIYTQPSAAAYLIRRGETSTALARRQIAAAFHRSISPPVNYQ